MELDTSVRYIKGIGEKRAQAFAKLGVLSLGDLISFFPRKYDDRSVFRPIAETLPGESVCVRAMVADTPRLSRVRRGLDIVKLRAVDDSGSLELTFFNQSYAKDNLVRGESYRFFGKIEQSGGRRGMVNPVYEKDGGESRVTGRIVPIYRLCAGLNQRAVQQAVRQGLDSCAGLIPEVLPDIFRERRKLVAARYAYENVHFPADLTVLELARRRLVYEELFTLALALGMMRGERTHEAGISIAPADMGPFWAALPFRPTDAQRRAVAQATADMSSGAVMNRLLQGDVGSGKTLVAAALIWQCRESGYLSAFMAPTEILTDQHLKTLTALLSPLGVRIGKLTGSMTAKEKRAVKEKLKAGELDAVIGTHALLSEDVELPGLALVIADEQHRFGVAQRSALVGKGQRPHVLVMSATPSPRTLALIIYGDLDISVIDELPPGRQRVDTFAVDESYRERLNGFISRLVREGRQVFVVCPMVEENEELPTRRRSAEEYSQTLSRLLPSLRVACVHGRMKAKEKDAVMAAFAGGEIDVLVSTTVIEVGVDVPNAALMIVENAECFGLSQLHQLRGRVGRGAHKSYCVLVSDAEGEEVLARLDTLCRTNDGFKISEEDLRLRGPGDFFGSRQHGLPEMHVADLGADLGLLQQAQADAGELLTSDPELSGDGLQALRGRVERLFSLAADGFN